MELGVGITDVGFLVNDETFCTVIYELAVLVVFHGAYFDGDGRDEGFNGVYTFLEVSFRDKFRVLASDEEDVSESKAVKVLSLCDDLLDGECGA